MSLTINFSLANANISNDILSEFISNLNLNAEIYKLSPPKNVHISAATDWKAVVGTVADGLTIIASLWTFYSEFINTNKENNSKSGVYITIQVNNNINNIWIGNEVKTKNDLIIKYNDAVKTVQLDSIKDKETVDSLMWKKIK